MAGQVRAERHTLRHRPRCVQGTCAKQRAESAIRPLCHAAFSCESMEAEHKKVRESVHIGMHDRAEIVCSSRPAHACKAARYAVESGAHSNPTQADGPSEPAPPTPYPQPTSDKLADTAASSSLSRIIAWSPLPLPTSTNGAVLPFLRWCRSSGGWAQVRLQIRSTKLSFYRHMRSCR